ncbi:transmembrane protein 69 [Osmerus mordax]|uniref:transmembrane protein 69 n=1 Tax=Osmerus mordax TaxID=8014 RepID=UPI00350FE3AA
MFSAIVRRHIQLVHRGWQFGTRQQLSCISVSASDRGSDDGGSSLCPRRRLINSSWPRQTRWAHGFHSSALRFKRPKETDPPTRELDLLRYDFKDIRKTPRPALILGLSGLIPFVSAPLVMALTETYLPEVAFAQVAYGASILSFLGGARWGFAIPESSPAKPDWINLVNSVVPPLLAWTAMLLSDSLTPAAIMVVMGLGISLHYDLSLLPTYPSWFKALRSILTVVAFLSLVATLVLQGIYPEKMLFSE